MPVLATGHVKKYRETMHRQSYRIIISCLMTGLLMSSLLARARAVSASGIMIVELQTAGAVDASAECVKVINQSAVAVSLEGWKLQYRAATGASWSTKASLSGELLAQGTLLLATTAYGATDASQLMQDGLAQAGGHVQLVDAAGNTHDVVGWGTALAPEGAAAPAPDKDQSLLRKSSTGIFTDSDNNLADFQLEAMPPSPPPSPVTPPAANTKPAGASTTPLNVGLLPPRITELLPNPASPQTDAQDEFIELFNPNAQVYTLKNYKIQTGISFTNSVSLADKQIPALGYLVITSADTSLSLSNTSGNVRLVDPQGNITAESVAYDQAEAGQAWILVDGEWQWSASPTPGTANMLVRTDSEEESSNTTAPAKAQAAKAAKTNKTTNKESDAAAQSAKSPVIHLIIIALVASLAVGYAIYEYRHDIGNIVYRFRAYRENRRTHRQASARR
jgi:hypothetical protein